MVLVVVSVLEARHFPRRVDSSLVVEGILNGEAMCTDPVPQCGGILQVQTELAWEMEPKALQQHKIHRTPIKIKCFTVDNASNYRKMIGYILMDLKAAQRKDQATLQWHKVLNASKTAPFPQLHLSLTVEEQKDGKKEDEDRTKRFEKKQKQQVLEYDRLLTLKLDSSGKYFTAATDSSHQDIFFVSITLQNPLNIHQNAGDYYFYYKLLGNDITSEVFNSSNFKPERASIRIKTTREYLSTLLVTQEELELCLCQGGESLAEGRLSLKLLSSQDTLDAKVELKSQELAGLVPTVEVRVQIERDVHMSSSLQVATSPPGTKSTQACTESNQSVKRNLTLSFEEASVAYSPSHKPPVNSDSVVENPEGHEGITVSSTSSVHSSSSEDQGSTGLSPTPVTAHEDIPVSYEVMPLSQAEAAVVSVSSPSEHNFLSKALPSSSLTNHSACISQYPHPQYPSVSPPSQDPLLNLNPTSAIHEETSIVSSACEVSTDHCQPLPHIDFTTLSQSYLETGYAHENSVHQFQLLIDIRSIQNIDLKEGVDCYLRYSYPFFGSPHPILVQPPVPLLPGTEQFFDASCCALTFATKKDHLLRQLHIQPLKVEIWSTGKKYDSNLVGIAKVPLAEVLLNEALSSGSVTKHKCSLSVPILPFPHLEQTCGFLQCFLMLEDHGSIHLSSERERHIGSTPSLQNNALPNSAEYQAAVELEMWKLSEEEAFRNAMKDREVEYLSKLGDEWKRREAEKQNLFVRKMEGYNLLEKKLQSALQAVQIRQNYLTSKETEVQEQQRRCLIKEQSIRNEYDSKIQQNQLYCEGQIAKERSRVKDLMDLNRGLKKQVTELSNRLSSRDCDFEAYCQQIRSNPESMLQAEITMLHLEKRETERKLLSAVKSKQHYKEQWARALKEVASFRQKDQASTKDRLHMQQAELELLKTKYIHFHNKEQHPLSKNLCEVKEEVTRQMQHLAPLIPQVSDHICDKHQSHLNSDVALLIEERDMLLQTGAYRKGDPTVQKINRKIETILKDSKPNS